ncbi:MAG: clan AA aspartic protease [Chloroflexi bacterium]|nr:clan AA aspartic protease [Chloroflexota bacterium]
MVTGRVVAHGAILKPVAEIAVYGRSNARARVQAVIDTGFTGHMTLPIDAIRALNLTLVAEEEMTMANGETVIFEAYSALADWHGQLRPVRVHCAEADPLIGMAMLRDHDLHVRVVPDGPVNIDPLA